MGMQINRIEKEFLLKTFLDRQIPINVHGDKKAGTFILTDFNDTSITLKNKENIPLQFKKDEVIRFFTSIDNSYFTFESKVLRYEEDLLTIENLENFCKNPERKFERINTLNMKVSFSLKGDTIELNFPKTDTFAIIEKPVKSEKFNDLSIAELLKSLKDHLKPLVSDHTLVMYREKTPSSLEEKLITRIGKILWIPDTEGDLPRDEPSLSSTVITHNEIADFLNATGTAASLLRSEIAALLYKKTKQNIYSEIYCPILYHEYAIGYIYAVNNKKENKPFTMDLVNYIYQFSKVLSYSLEIHGYFKQQAETIKHYQEPIIDMSAAGLLFATQTAEIDEKLNLLEDIDVTIKIKEKKIIIGSRIMRKFKDYSTFYFAAQFLRISDEDFNFLFEYLYGRRFTKRDEISWEGGSPPPLS